MKIQKLYAPAIRQFTLKRSRPMARSDQSIVRGIQQRKDSSGIKMPTSACHAPFRQFGKRFAVKLGDFERSLIDTSLTYDELKSAFHMMDKNNDGCVDVRELARLFVYDPRACEKFVKKIIDTGRVCQLIPNRKALWCQNYLLGEQKVDKPVKVDIDNSGNLSFSEFLMLMVKTEGVEGVRAAFQSYDADNSGTITIQELAGWMSRHGKKMSEEELEKMITAFGRRILREKAHEGNDLTSVESAIREIVRMIKTVKSCSRLSTNNRSDRSMVPYKRNNCTLAPILRTHGACTTLAKSKFTNKYTNSKALIEAPCNQVLRFA